MRILDEDQDRSIRRVALFLTRDEAESLVKQLTGMQQDSKTHHIHVDDASFEREITVAIYTPTDLAEFDARSRKLIEKDE